MHDRDVSFSRDVRPILSNHCFACHGPDENARQSDLRLDIEKEVDFDEVFNRINSNDPDYLMPPREFGKPLTGSKIEILKQWIGQGGRYEKHWSFVHPKQTMIPANSHPVDYFIDQKLAAAEAKRSPIADPATLIRRLYLDLIGLPPTLEQADAFINKPTQENYQSIVSQLLQSPRYGERWARRWLDLARYSDTNGFEKDRDRNIWPYRDWVIRMLNQGIPFDQFTIEQLAGDMLDNPTQDQLIATGFHRNTMLNEEGGIDPLEYRYYAMVDRVATTGTTWLGLTLGCAQCHTHKYDPITQDDYFGMMAFLNNADEPELFLKSAETASQRIADQNRASQLMSELKNKWPDSNDQKTVPTLEQAFTEWFQHETANAVEWRVITPRKMSANEPHLTLEKQGTIFVWGDTTKFDTYCLEFDGQGHPVSAIRLEALPDERLPGGGPGMTYYEGRKGDFFLAEILIENDDHTIPWGKASETYARNRFGNHSVSAQLATDGDVQTGWCIDGRNGFRQAAVFNLQQPIPANQPIKLTMQFGRHFASSLGKFRLSVANSDDIVQASVMTDDQSRLLAQNDDMSLRKLQDIFLMNAPQVEKHADKIRQLTKPHYGVSTLVMRERDSGQTRSTWLYHRGEFTQPKHQVQPRLPEAVFDPAHVKHPTNRLEFARWLVSENNPLTARVVVNRHWSAFFGTGLVETVDDFGMQGQSPTHPHLLDYLAVEFMKQGWSIKKLHELIVTSQTYQQSSRVHDVNKSIKNGLLSRFPRTRLEAEIIRDSALAASGLLELKMFGPPVRPPQPAGAAANYQKSTWKASNGADRFRRSVYTYQKRTAPFAMFTTFDGISGESCVARRNVSNTPLQALTLMNDPMFVEISAAYGSRIANVDGDLRTKLTNGFRWLLTRQPDSKELEMLEAFYNEHQDWTALARVLLCLDEAITRN